MGRPHSHSQKGGHNGERENEGNSSKARNEEGGNEADPATQAHSETGTRSNTANRNGAAVSPALGPAWAEKLMEVAPLYEEMGFSRDTGAILYMLSNLLMQVAKINALMKTWDEEG